MIQSKLPGVGTTIFTRMSALAEACDAINLSQGFPDFDAPESLREALGRHAMAGHNQYAPMAGVSQLREQIALQVDRYRQVQVDPELEVTVVPGATEGIFCAVMACVRPGDEVLVFDPCYDSYEPSVELAGGRTVHIPLSPQTFQIDWQQVEAAITPRCRMIIINSPHNPTGATVGRDDLAVEHRAQARLLEEGVVGVPAHPEAGRGARRLPDAQQLGVIEQVGFLLLGRVDQRLHVADEDVDADVADGRRCYRESRTVEPGCEVVVVETPVGRLGLSVCYDLRFPIWSRNLSPAYDLALYVANWPASRSSHWKALSRLPTKP